MTALSTAELRHLGPCPLDVAIASPEPEVMVLTVAGEVDAPTVPALWAAVLDACGSGAARVVLDLGGITFFCAGGITALLAAQHAAGRSGAELHLTGVTDNRHVAIVLDLTGLTGRFHLHPTVEAALHAAGGADDHASDSGAAPDPADDATIPQPRGSDPAP